MALLLAGVIAGACASGNATPSSTPEPAEAVIEVPEDWGAKAQANAESVVDAEPVVDAESVAVENALVDNWWQSFELSGLDALVHEALDKNNDLRAAAAAVEAAVAQARIAGADRAPEVTAGFDASTQQQVFVGLPIPGGPLKTNFDVFSPAVGIRWEADLWGRLRASQKAALVERQAAQEDLAAARLGIAAQTVRAFLTVLETERQLELAENTYESRGLSTERITARYQNGVGEPLDVRLARANEAQAQSFVEQRQRRLDAARRQLEILLGRYPAGELAADLEELPEVPTDLPPVLPAELVTRRPDLRAAERRLEAAGWRIAEARRALYPSLSFNINAGTTSNQVGDLLNGDFSVWSLAGSLLQPLFQGGRLRAAVDFAEASREQALALYVEAILQAFADVETVLAAERFLASEEEALRIYAEEAAAARDLAEKRYRAGVGDYLMILESQRQLFTAESRLITVRSLRLTGRVDLYAALGGDFKKAVP